VDQLKVNNKIIAGRECAPYIIAEIGTNHNQNLDQAINLIDQISLSNCDCIKFQIYEPEEIVNSKVLCSEYGLDKFYGNITAQEMFENHLKTPKEWFPKLLDYIHSKGKDCMATLHGAHGIDWAKSFDFDLIKIASMDHTNLPFFKELIANVEVPILASFGMAEVEDIDAAMEVLGSHSKGLGIFYCSSVYPPGPDDISLGNIVAMAKRYQVPVGFSDHTMDTKIACAAIACGAKIFEKHVTIDRSLIGPDHTSAVEIDEFCEYVKTLHEINKYMNIGFRGPSVKERENKSKYLKSIMFKNNLKKGEKISLYDIYTARPGDGISPAFRDQIVGKTLACDVNSEVPLQWSDIDSR
jgi:sialic acid synthase SpsE